MNTPEDDDMNSLFNCLPYDLRSNMNSAIIGLRTRLNQTIPPSSPSKKYIAIIAKLRNILSKVPFVSRKKLKNCIFLLLEKVIDLSQEVFSVFAICLILLEISLIRNCDRTDLEILDVVYSLTKIECILSKLRDRIYNSRVNYPNLQSWSYGMLIFTYRGCILWLSDQDYKIKDLTSDFGLYLNSTDIESMPRYLYRTLKSQLMGLSIDNPPKFDSLFDSLFICAINYNYNSKSIKETDICPNVNNSICLFEETEPMFMKSVDYISLLQTEHCSSIKNFKNMALITDLNDLITNKDSDDIVLYMGYLENMLTNKTVSNLKELQPSIIVIMRSAANILARFSPKLLQPNSPLYSESVKNYENIFCSIIRLWIVCLDRTLAISLPLQPFIWISPFTTPEFQLMSLNGFYECGLLLANFLVKFLSYFRTLLLVSPHWFIQLLTDFVISILNRMELVSVRSHQDLNIAEDMMSTLLSSIGRTWLALRADEPEIQPELSRAIKPLLDSIVIRLSTIGSNLQRHRICESIGTNKLFNNMKSYNISSLLSTNFRARLNSNVIFPLFACIDPWALGQSRIGIKPLSARELLRQLINSYLQEIQASSTGAEVPIPKFVMRHKLNQFRKSSITSHNLDFDQNAESMSVSIPMTMPVFAGTARLANLKKKFRSTE